MDLRVTRGHAERGQIEAADSCPVALALIDAGFASSEVYTNESGLVSPIIYVTYPLSGAPGARERFYPTQCEIPKKLLKEILAFDRGNGFKPGTYRIPGLKRPKKG